MTGLCFCMYGYLFIVYFFVCVQECTFKYLSFIVIYQLPRESCYTVHQSFVLYIHAYLMYNLSQEQGRVVGFYNNYSVAVFPGPVKLQLGCGKSNQLNIQEHFKLSDSQNLELGNNKQTGWIFRNDFSAALVFWLSCHVRLIFPNCLDCHKFTLSSNSGGYIVSKLKLWKCSRYTNAKSMNIIYLFWSFILLFTCVQNWSLPRRHTAVLCCTKVPPNPEFPSPYNVKLESLQHWWSVGCTRLLLINVFYVSPYCRVLQFIIIYKCHS